MNCSTCNYRKHIPLYSKCAGVSGKTKVGTAYYCGHPKMKNPVPVISLNDSILEDCPINKSVISVSHRIQNAEVSRS
ncbi:hypothetical protein [Methanolobus sp. ZRKC5]|uniref:hypothetical protein n=1 Tax=unclassified Methanolobus TaxID=2629569 RepID=UPI00313B4279